MLLCSFLSTFHSVSHISSWWYSWLQVVIDYWSRIPSLCRLTGPYLCFLTRTFSCAPFYLCRTLWRGSCEQDVTCSPGRGAHANPKPIRALICSVPVMCFGPTKIQRWVGLFTVAADSSLPPSHRPWCRHGSSLFTSECADLRSAELWRDCIFFLLINIWNRSFGGIS